MVTFAISVGIDPNELRVFETPDNFGTFETREAAAKRLIEMVEGQMEELRRSKAHARRILAKAEGRAND